jgi:hypothetical protein
MSIHMIIFKKIFPKNIHIIISKHANTHNWYIQKFMEEVTCMFLNMFYAC